MDGKTIVLETKQLHNFSNVPTKMYGSIKCLSSDMKKIDWVARLNNLLQDVQEVDMPSDMTKSGLVEEAILDFCVSSESTSRLNILSNGVFRNEIENEKDEWWFRE